MDIKILKEGFEAHHGSDVHIYNIPMSFNNCTTAYNNIGNKSLQSTVYVDTLSQKSKEIEIDFKLQTDVLSIKVFPNPATNSFTVICDQKENINSAIKLIVYNNLGSMLDSYMLENGQINIDASAWAKGIYYLYIYSDNLKTTKKLIKQ